MSSLAPGGGSGAGSVEGVVEEDGKLTMNVNGGGDLDGHRRSLRREAPLEMKDRLGLETERTMASSDEHKDWVVGGSGTPWEEAMRADLLLENSSEVPIVVEPRGAQRPELVLEGGMDAGMMDVVMGAGAHFEKLVGSMKDRARRCLMRQDGQCVATFASCFLQRQTGLYSVRLSGIAEF